MELKKSHMIVILGGVVTLVSAFLAWSQNLNLIDVTSLLKAANGNFVYGISTYLMGLIIIFGAFAIIEPLIDAYKDSVYDGKFGIWSIIDGIVIIVAAALVAYCIVDYGLDFGIGCIVAIVGGALVSLGGALASKGI